jgi:hypothetical protein
VDLFQAKMNRNYRISEYWDYYEPDYEWGREGWYAFQEKASEDAFSDAGFNDSHVRNLIDSGYIVINGDLVIDRYYGGLVNRYDSRSRMPLHIFTGDPVYPQHPAKVHHATSLNDVKACIREWQTHVSRPFLFRGQNSSYPLQRKRINPAYAIEGYGEVSLLASLWRKMVKVNAGFREEFINISLVEWSKVLYADFDMEEVESRRKAALDRGEWMYSAQDMEDSDDPLLSEFGRLQLDLIMGFDHDLSIPLQTLLQHYGLLSPLLDLTSDVDVALFFASHQFESDDDARLTPTFVGTNSRNAVLYVFRPDVTEMRGHEHHRALEKFHPQRPIRQFCHVAFCGQDALNLPAEFIHGIIALDFDDLPGGGRLAQDLFPNVSDDPFLGSLKENLLKPQHVSSLA